MPRGWFKFGIVRGFIGAVIGSVILKLYGQQLIHYLLPNLTISQTQLTTAYVVLFLSIPLVGFEYWFGSRIASRLGIHGSNYSTIILVSIVTFTIFTIFGLVILLLEYYLVTIPNFHHLLPKLIIRSAKLLPINFVEELVFVSIAYLLYKTFHAKLPEV